MTYFWLAASGVRLVTNSLTLDLKSDMRRLVGIPWARGEMRALDSDVRLWLVWCRVLTGWDTPAWQPNAKCPVCGIRGTLRIRLDRHTACCIESSCRAAWDEDTIEYLATHVRLSTSGLPALA